MLNHPTGGSSMDKLCTKILQVLVCLIQSRKIGLEGKAMDAVQSKGMSSSTGKQTISQRGDLRALMGGIVFSLAFTGLIAWAGQFLDRSTFLPDQGASWYFWKLPNPTFWSHATAWVFYIAHQA